MKKLTLCLGVAGLCLFLSLFATPAAAGDQQGASKFITGLGEQALGAITNKGLSADRKRATLRALFEKSVDIDWIAKFVLGRHWKIATDEQKKAYQTTYKDFLVKNYTTNFSEFEDTTFKVTDARAGDKPGEYVLTMTLTRPGHEDIHVDYRVRESGGSYRVFDFVVEGVSLITSQRGEFNSVATRDGMDKLISLIQKKVAEVEAGK